MELLAGCPFGVADEAGVYPAGSVLGDAQRALVAYRRACQISGHHVPEHPKSGHKRVR